MAKQKERKSKRKKKLEILVVGERLLEEAHKYFDSSRIKRNVSITYCNDNFANAEELINRNFSSYNGAIIDLYPEISSTISFDLYIKLEKRIEDLLRPKVIDETPDWETRYLDPSADQYYEGKDSIILEWRNYKHQRNLSLPSGVLLAQRALDYTIPAVLVTNKWKFDEQVLPVGSWCSRIESKGLPVELLDSSYEEHPLNPFHPESNIMRAYDFIKDCQPSGELYTFYLEERKYHEK